MKKVLMPLLVLIAFFMIPGCKQNSPTAPVATATPANVEGTVVAVLTNVAIANATNTKVAQETATAAASLYTPTITSTSTQTPNMTQTIGVILTVVGEGNATATKQAQEIQTAIAILFTRTLTSTITPSPNQTGTAEAIGTMIANIHESETEAVILSRTPTPSATPSITPTPTLTFTVTDTYTATPTVTITATITVTLTSTSTPIPISYSDIVSVPGGTYTQTDGSSSFVHTISDFKMGKYEVTYDLWYTVKAWAGTNGYVFANAGREGNDGTIGAALTAAKYEPVTTINWRDVIVWCNAYSQMTGLAPVYCSDAGYTTPIKISTNNSTIETVLGTVDNPYVNWSTTGYRLPTEGEWQYAASYSVTPYNYASGDTAAYDTSGTIGNYCWYNTNSGYVTHNVGNKTANALGIYDMSGNVMEWCWDWYGTYPGTSTNYRGAASGSYRVIRGGSCYDSAGYLQVGGRYSYDPYNAYYLIGFRLVRTN